MKMKNLVPLTLLLFSAPFSTAEECGDMEKVHRKFQVCQRKEFIAYQSQGGTMCQLLENIIETCDSLWYYCVKSQQQILYNKRNYVQKFLSRYPDESLQVENCPYIKPFSEDVSAENEIDTGPSCSQTKRRSVDIKFTNCIYNYAAMVNSNLTDPTLPHHKVVYTMCQAMRNLTADCFQLLPECFSEEESQQMEKQSKMQMIETMMSLQKEGITESTLNQCDQMDATTTTAYSTPTSTFEPTSTTIEPTTSTMTTTVNNDSLDDVTTTTANDDSLADVATSTVNDNSLENEATTINNLDYTSTTAASDEDATTKRIDATSTPDYSTTDVSDVDVTIVTDSITSTTNTAQEIGQDTTTSLPTTAKDDVFIDEDWADNFESAFDDDESSTTRSDTTTLQSNILSDDHAAHGHVVTTQSDDTTASSGHEAVTSAPEDNLEVNTLSVEIHYEVNGPEFDPKDSMYTADLNSVDYSVAADRVVDDRSTPDPDTQKRSSPDVVVSERSSSSGCGLSQDKIFLVTLFVYFLL